MKLDDLKNPLPKIHWRAQMVSKKDENNPKAMALAYMDARDVMDRLDAVCGPENWMDSYVESAKGRVICTISIFVEGVWVSKSDGAGDTAVEGEKGGISDAFKRAAVKWGIGRYLYAMKTPWAACELYNGKWAKWTPDGLAYLNKIHDSYKPEELPETVAYITDDQRTELQAMFDGLGVNVALFCQKAKIKSLKEVPADNFEASKAWIFKQSEQKKEAA